MRAAVGGLVLGLGAFAALAFGLAEAQGQRPSVQERVASSPELLALSHDSADGRQQITLVDTRQRVMAVYHVDKSTGALSLRSVRNLQWDLMIEDFNSNNPTPREIRALKEQR
jgi:hypothetical protein